MEKPKIRKIQCPRGFDKSRKQLNYDLMVFTHNSGCLYKIKDYQRTQKHFTHIRNARTPEYQTTPNKSFINKIAGVT